MSNCAELFDAVASQDVQQVALHLQQHGGCPLNTMNENGQTALYVASEYEDASICACLMRAGADVDIAEPSGYTPLHLATYLSRVNTVAALLSNGANANLCTGDGSSALHLAAANTTSLPLVKLLCEGGSDLMLKDENGKLPIQCIEDRSSHIYAYLKQKLIELKNSRGGSVAASAPVSAPTTPAPNNEEMEKMARVVKLLKENVTKEREVTAMLKAQLAKLQGDGGGSLICQKCQDEPRKIVFLPCSHFKYCGECAAVMSNCAHCDVEIMGKIPAVL